MATVINEQAHDGNYSKWVICRVCLKEIEEEMIELFSDDFKTELLVEKVEKYGGIKLDPHANLPASLCMECFGYLRTAHKFYTLCQISQKKLEKFFELSSKDEKEIVINVKVEGEQTKQESDGFDLEENADNSDLNYKIVLETMKTNEELSDKHLKSKYSEYRIMIPNSGNNYIEKGNDEVEHGETVNLLVETIYDDNIENDYNDHDDNPIEFLQEDDASYLSNENVEMLDDNEHSMDSSTIENASYLDKSEEIHGLVDEDEDNKYTSPIQLLQPISKQLPDKMFPDVEFTVNDNTGSDYEITPILNVEKRSLRTPTKRVKKKSRGNIATDSDDMEQISYQCNQCGNLYNEKAKLTLHMKNHMKVKRHECEICHKRFAQTPQLARHMNSHTGNRPFKCKFCNSRFADPSTCIKHERIHTLEKPYCCDICGKTFAYSNVLKVHSMIHTGEKPHSCQYCGKKFSQRHHTKAHERIHASAILSNES